jgi:phage minor structural protein
MKDNIVIIKAQHISYDLKEALVENVNMVNITCKQATQALISRSIGNDKFVVDSNVETRANFSQQRVNVLESIVGLENSIFDTFSENDLVIERDNFHYNINKKVDNDTGVVIAYSKNLLAFKGTINSNNIITGIYPFAHLRNGAILKLKEKVIYSKYKDNYATPRIKAIDFTKETVVNEETLRSEASKYFENGCDIPKLNYEVDFISLYSNNILLKDKFRSLEEIILGDIVTIQDSKIGINVKARVIKTVYNVLKKRYEKVELGNFKNEYRSSKKNEQNNLKKIVRSVMD